MPTSLAELGPFALTVTAIAVSPGPDTMLIVRYALVSGRRSGLAAVGGVQLGLVAHTLLAAAGVSGLIASSPTLFRAVALTGAFYLGWLGMQSMLSRETVTIGEGRPVAAWRACRAAILCNLLNPKVLVLFLALYPNFLRIERGQVTAQIVVLSTVLIAINIIWQTALALAAATASRWLARPRVQKTVRRATGAILLGFAVAMLREHVL